MRKFPFSVNLFLRGGEIMHFGCEDQEKVSLYVINQMAAGELVTFNDGRTIHTAIRGSDIAGFQIVPRNIKAEELMEQRLELDARRMKAESQELDRRNNSESWRGEQ